MPMTSRFGQYQTSPERDSTNWHCLACGNTSRFVGIDDHSSPGYDFEDCTCGARDRDDPDDDDYYWRDDCECFVVLRQELTIDEDGEPSYGEHDGSDGAEINAYTRIYCGECSALLWRDPSLELPEDAP